MPVQPPISDEKAARIVELAHAGVPRNKIARDVGVSVATVTKYASAAGVSFDRRRTAAATAAAKVDSAQRREAEAVELLTDIAAQRSELRVLRPKDLREHETRARALAHLTQAWTRVAEAFPIPDTTTEDIRDGFRDFLGTVTQLNAAYKRIAAYERLYGALDSSPEEIVPDYDDYGQVPASGDTGEGGETQSVDVSLSSTLDSEGA